MIEYSDEAERRAALAGLGGIEDTIWIRTDGTEKIFAIANEDLQRSTGEKASAVHFLRFELTSALIAAFKTGAAIQLGIDHPGLSGSVTLTPEQQHSLAADLS
jgi:hypothetical protein